MHFNMPTQKRKRIFLPFDNEVLIFFSKEDTIFCESLKQNLVDLMTNPTVVWDLKGGHLAMMTSIDEYVETLAKFICERNENYQQWIDSGDRLQ